jgi:GTP cyclohydrolase III
LTLHLQIAAEVSSGSRYTGVSEIVAYYTEIDARLQECDSAAVAKYVGGDAAMAQSREVR